MLVRSCSKILIRLASLHYHAVAAISYDGDNHGTFSLMHLDAIHCAGAMYTELPRGSLSDGAVQFHFGSNLVIMM